MPEVSGGTWRPTRLDMPMGAMFLLGVGLRARPATVWADLVGLAIAVGVYAVLVRWGAWHWLAALASLPALMSNLDPAGGAGALTMTTVGSAAVAAWCWRSRTIAASAAAVGVAALALGAAWLVGGSPAIDGHVRPDVMALLGVAALPALAAVLGLGRSAGSGLRHPTALLLLLPTVWSLGLAAAPGRVGADVAPLLVWWPAAGALGFTALLRGRRGPTAARPQADEVDEAAAAGFRDRYGAPALSPVVVVITAYNEVEGLPKVLVGLPEQICGLAADVLVVDDGSTDGTADGIEDTRAYAVHCSVNRGQGAALRLGYRLAREHGARYLVTTDADGQYDAADLPVVLAPILDGRADLVTGSRILGRQHTSDRVRRTGVHVFAVLASALVGHQLTDTSFGLRAMRAELTAVVTLNEPQYQASELLLGAFAHGYRVLEVPATMHVRSAGSSKKGHNLVYGPRYAAVMLATWWREGCPRPAPEIARALHGARGRDRR